MASDTAIVYARRDGRGKALVQFGELLPGTDLCKHCRRLLEVRRDE